MEMEGISVQGYQMECPPMNLELLRTDKKRFDMFLIVAHIEEAKKGFKVKKVGKTTKKGTKITYSAIENEEDLKQYVSKMRDLVKQYNENYGTNYTL